MKHFVRITINSQVCNGKPCVRGMQWTVESILDMLGSEMSPEQILEKHPELQKEDILASLQYAKLIFSSESSLVGLTG